MSGGALAATVSFAVLAGVVGAGVVHGQSVGNHGTVPARTGTETVQNSTRTGTGAPGAPGAPGTVCEDGWVALSVGVESCAHHGGEAP
ncbi:hypothetical protein QMK19_03850 [Streptomyces sp. H10-C2]|uniref:hypothetical protein n=1 Tax=unclassified Streptomyces TaxID=2593676 RepID=UPI0024B8E1DC|nr:MULTISPECIES: hypothetical protein [unclassified Streptomyces]MDJ0345218.1 hypothetical protein [Streptomyces sp. PH10-H1]MDJ0368836.1 hypothetical protein [Streptomyces sp. H10-C2]